MPKRKWDIGRTYLSGNEERKIKAAKENEARSLCGAMEKFVVVKQTLDETEASEDSNCESVVPPSEASQETEYTTDDIAQAEPTPPLAEPDLDAESIVDYSDPASWPQLLTAVQRDFLITEGRCRLNSDLSKLFDCPQKFSNNSCHCGLWRKKFLKVKIDQDQLCRKRG